MIDVLVVFNGATDGRNNAAADFNASHRATNIDVSQPNVGAQGWGGGSGPCAEPRRDARRRL